MASDVEAATTNELPSLEVDNDANSNFTQTASLDSSVMISSTASVFQQAIAWNGLLTISRYAIKEVL